MNFIEKTESCIWIFSKKKRKEKLLVLEWKPLYNIFSNVTMQNIWCIAKVTDRLFSFWQTEPKVSYAK